MPIKLKELLSLEKEIQEAESLLGRKLKSEEVAEIVKNHHMASSKSSGSSTDRSIK